MTQQKESTLLDSIQSEVSHEASPMLEFLVKHAGKIFAGLVAFILVLLLFGGWNYFSGSKKRNAEEALGKILIMPETSEKITKLEEMLADGPDGLKQATLLAIAQSSAAQGQLEKAASAWAEVAKNTDGPTKLVAALSQASTFSAQGKYAEALAVFEGILAYAQDDIKPNINSFIAVTAERMGDWDKAIAACTAIIDSLKQPDEKGIWEQRRAYYMSKK